MSRLPSTLFPALGLVASLLVGSPLAAQTFNIIKVADNSTVRPDNAGVYRLDVQTAPAFDGQWVVYRDTGPKDDQSLQSIWSFNTADGTYRKLVDLNTRIPGKSVTFHDLQLTNSSPVVRRGVVIFMGGEATTAGVLQGIYAVPAGGGSITRIADTTTANPSGGTFGVFDSAGRQSGAFSFDGAMVSFFAQGSNRTLGSYVARSDGSAMAAVADDRRSVQGQGGSVNGFFNPVVSAHNVVMFASDGNDPSVGYNGLYLGSTSGGDLVELLNSSLALPGATASKAHTSFDLPSLAFDGSLVAFHAAASSISGLYWTDLTSHTINTIADTGSSLPGLGPLYNVGSAGLAVSQGNVLFTAGDSSGKTALYLWNGSATRILAAGDQLDGKIVKSISDPAPGALYGSAFAFTVAFNPTGLGVYVAMPKPNSVSVSGLMSGASYARNGVAPGEIVTLFGAGIGPAKLTSFALDASNRVPGIVGSTRVLFNGVPAPVIYSSNGQTAAIAPFEIAGQSTVDVRVEYNGVQSAAVTLPVVATHPALFSADSTGSGAGAILNGDLSLNTAANPASTGSVVALYLTGLGTLNPNPATGSVTGTPLPGLQTPVTVTIGGRPATVQYQGAAPGSIAGLYQVNCVIPAGLTAGPAAVVVTSGGRVSQPNLTVAVR